MKSKVYISIIASIIMCVFAIESSASDHLTPSVTPISFEFTQNLHWGESGIEDWVITDDAVECNTKHTDYVGLTKQQIQTMAIEQGSWSKAWLRFEVYPEVDWAFVYSLSDVQKDELIATSGVDYEDPLFLSNIYIQNVRIENASETGIYPRARMMMTGTPEISDSKGVSLWYLEVLIENRGRSDDEIIAAVQQSVLLLEVDIYTDTFERHHIRVPLSNICRVTALSQSVIDFYVEECFLLNSIPDFVGYTFRPFSLPLDIAADAYEYPEDYWIVSMPVWMDKSSAGGVCSITAEAHSENAWVFYSALDDIAISVNDTCCTGTHIPISGFVLLIKKENDDRESLESIIKKLDIDMVFSTEFAGVIYWDGSPDGKNGFAGPRYVRKLNMMNCEIEFSDK